MNSWTWVILPVCAPIMADLFPFFLGPIVQINCLPLFQFIFICYTFEYVFLFAVFSGTTLMGILCLSFCSQQLYPFSSQLPLCDFQPCPWDGLTDGALHLSIVRSTSGTKVSSDSNENLCFSGGLSPRPYEWLFCPGIHHCWTQSGVHFRICPPNSVEWTGSVSKVSSLTGTPSIGLLLFQVWVPEDCLSVDLLTSKQLSYVWAFGVRE